MTKLPIRKCEQIFLQCLLILSVKPYQNIKKNKMIEVEILPRAPMRGLLVEPLGRPRFFTPSGDTPSTEFAGFGPASEKGPEEPCPIAGDPVADDAGTNASDTDPSGPYFLGRPRFFLATGSLMPGDAMAPLPPVAAAVDMLGPWTATCGW